MESRAYAFGSLIPTDGSTCVHEFHVCTLWALRCATTYCLTIDVSATEEKSLQELHVRTLPFPLPLSSAEGIEEPQFLLDEALLDREDFTDCACAQDREAMLYFPKMGRLQNMLPSLHGLFFNGLFTLPQNISNPYRPSWLVQLPNSKERYALDLRSPITSSFSPPANAPVIPTSLAPIPTASFPWRRNSKLRRLLKSKAYALRVEDTQQGILSVLRRAAALHRDRDGVTWLCEDLIELFGEYAANHRRATHPFCPRLLCIQLVRAEDGEVVAGCCGFAIGSVYHDYTMFTCTRAKEGLGTALTKILGEALQRCGYALWYWGIKVDYMTQFEARYGATGMSRKAFYECWNEARCRPPLQSVDSFLRENLGMLPYYHDR